MLQVQTTITRTSSLEWFFQENHFLVECAYLAATTTGLAQELHRLQITAAAKPIIFFHLGTLLKKEM